jgi:DNA-binding NtrC family response regulator
MHLDHAFLAGAEILLLEDDATLRKRIGAYLRSTGAEVSETGEIAAARRLLADVRFDFALIDLHLPDGEALILLREGVFSENTGVVVMTAFGGVKKAVEAIRLGAGDYLAKPFELEELPLAFLRCREERSTARREAHQLSSSPRRDELFFGRSLASVRAELDTILAAERRLGQRLPPVLIEGETGTGKSALARWLHAQGPRATRPFIVLNCAALPEQLAEAELFGHERGAFTDAKQARIGLFEAADGGTLFLDEIAALSAAAQAKILLAIEDGRFRRVGGTKELTIDTRVLAANNRPLRDAVAAGAFREDLFHRLSFLRVTLPPLRERGNDIGELAKHLLAEITARHRCPALTISAAGQLRLQAQPWPGNIRELAHELERAVIFGDGGPLEFAHLSPPPPASTPWRAADWRVPEAGFSLDGAIEEFVALALRETNGNVSAAARRLGVTREFLRYRLSGEKRETPPGAEP